MTLAVIEVDARGRGCPIPTLRLRRAFEAAAPGSMIRLLADDPMVRIDVPHFAGQVGARLLSISEADGLLTLVLEKPVTLTAEA